MIEVIKKQFQDRVQSFAQIRSGQFQKLTFFIITIVSQRPSGVTTSDLIKNGIALEVSPVCFLNEVKNRKGPKIPSGKPSQQMKMFLPDQAPGFLNPLAEDAFINAQAKCQKKKYRLKKFL